MSTDDTTPHTTVGKTKFYQGGTRSAVTPALIAAAWVGDEALTSGYMQAL
ncbi:MULTISPECIES: hypothetical protein [unclassified Pseudomonas]|nr:MULTISPECIES: hypothetical protein [unclassified Pseudomonas]MDH0305131.1 hypothetical protein [Pseudomonas sp. GD04091]MDH1985497.1 hypothetical protein [Pseudomonas sp. GD03689]